jgi:hypothetical protein
VLVVRFVFEGKFETMAREELQTTKIRISILYKITGILIAGNVN